VSGGDLRTYQRRRLIESGTGFSVAPAPVTPGGPVLWDPSFCWARARPVFLGKGKSSVTALRARVELGGGVLGRGNAEPPACLVALHKITHGRDVWQRVRAFRRGHTQRTQLAGSDVLD
jgi:hypothetical protein